LSTDDRPIVPALANPQAADLDQQAAGKRPMADGEDVQETSVQKMAGVSSALDHDQQVVTAQNLVSDDELQSAIR
jgi:hypothetical protein